MAPQGKAPAGPFVRIEPIAVSYLGPTLRRARKRSSPWLRGVLAVLLSLGLNAIALRVVDVSGITGGASAKGARPVVLAPLPPGQWDANRRVGPEAQPQPLQAAPLPPPEPPPPRDAKGQVVDVEPSKNRTPPKQSRFLSEQDSSVDKETRSRHARPGYENTLAKPSGPKPTPPAQARPQVASGQPAAGARAAGAAAAAEAPARAPRATARPAESPSRQRLAFLNDARGDQSPRDRKQTPSPEPEGLQLPSLGGRPGGGWPPGAAGREGPPSQLMLRPTAESYERLSGGPAPDRLDGIEEGEGTFLNTRGWKYAGYFNRIKRSLANAWDPETAMRARDPSGERFGQHDWLTVLLVKLDDRGGLKDVAVQRSSGLDFLDNTAVQAFRRVQPFVNPPQGLADSRGEIVFNFGFSYEVGRGLAGLFGHAPPQ